MKDKCDVLLIGFEEWENLGLRYIAAFLSENGIDARIVPYESSSHERILSNIRNSQPAIVGFSLIFQRMISEFAELIAYLRKHGAICHFTMGGHYPTVDSNHLLSEIPGLDSVILCEGEETLLELVLSINEPEAWREIRGIVFRSGQDIVRTAPRRLLEDLDSLPFPVRGDNLPSIRGIGMCSIAGSRGCFYDCCFCSIREFYSTAPGPNRRSRSPGNVVSEMKKLYQDRGIRIFIFEDDDFVMRSPTQKAWIREFTDLLHETNLADRILWRVSCRVDEVDTSILDIMRKAGLASIYLGIESGSQQGLNTFNKHYSVNDIHHALDMIYEVGIPFEFGFMILHPDCSFDTIRLDIDFLKQISARGRAVVHFTKMLPYAGTAISRRLKEEGRLTGGIEAPDYPFTDPRLDLLQVFFTQAFHYRNFDSDGLVERLRFAKLDALTLQRFYSDQFDTSSYMDQVYELIRQGNESCLEKMSLAVRFMECRSEHEILDNWWFLEKLAYQERQLEQLLTVQLDILMSRYVVKGVS